MLVFVLIVPFILIIPTNLNLIGIELKTCYALENNFVIYYSYFLEIFFSIWIAKTIFYEFFKNKERKKEILFFGLGIVFFLLAFSFGNIIGSITSDWIVAQYGLIGMPIFVAILTYIIVKYNAFSVKLLATQAFVWSLSILIGSQFFFIKIPINFLLNGITFISSIVLGIFLIKSVKSEVQQREYLEKLKIELEESNTKLKNLDKLKSEFLSLASHQLRSPLTAIKGYASMLFEGSFGKLESKQEEATKRIYTSAQGLINVVEDLLDISKIEQGGMKYIFEPIDISKIVNELYSEMQISADSKKLKFNLDIIGEKFITLADATKLKQVFLNLVDNSIKYTQSGYISLRLEKNDKNVVFSVKDSGMGMTPETMSGLFEKFNRGADKTNTGGSGLGLYLAREISRAHKGDITISSEGIGKGSIFKVEIPLIQDSTIRAI